MTDTIAIMRKRVLDMAIRGELVEQREHEGSADETLLYILNKKAQLTKSTKEIPNRHEKDTPFLIPKNWRWVKLGSVGITQTGNTPPTKNKEYYNGDIPFVKPDNIYKDHIEYDTNLKLTNLGLEKARSVYADSILMVCIGTIGKTFITDRLCAFNQQINSLTPYIEESYHTKFISRVLESNYFQILAWDSSSATTISILNKGRWNDLLIPFPPSEEQKRIVAKVEEIFAIIDQISTRKEDSLAIIEKIRQTSLQNAIMGQLVEQNENDEPASDFVKKIQAKKEQLIKEKKIKKENILLDIKEENIPFEIPENWNWIRLGDLLGKIGSGSTPKGGVSVYVETGIPFIRSQNVYNDGLRLKNVAYITEETNNSKSGSQVFAGDILLNITGASIGRCALVPDDFEIGNVNQHVLINRPIDTRIRQYLHIALTSPYISNEIMSLQKGGTKEGLSATNAKLLKIPFPPLSEQQRIVKKLDQIMDICDQMEAIFDGSSQTNRALKVAE